MIGRGFLARARRGSQVAQLGRRDAAIFLDGGAYRSGQKWRADRAQRRDVDFAGSVVRARASNAAGVSTAAKSDKVCSVLLAPEVAKALGVLSRRDRLTRWRPTTRTTPDRRRQRQARLARDAALEASCARRAPGRASPRGSAPSHTAGPRLGRRVPIGALRAPGSRRTSRIARTWRSMQPGARERRPTRVARAGSATPSGQTRSPSAEARASKLKPQPHVTAEHAPPAAGATHGQSKNGKHGSEPSPASTSARTAGAENHTA